MSPLTRRLLRSGIGVFVLAGFLAIYFCGTSPDIDEIVMCRRVIADTKAPAARTTVFGTDDQALHCCIRLAGARVGTKLRSRWIVEDAEGLAAESILGQIDFDVSDECWTDYTYLPKEPGLAPGKYRIDVWLNPRSDRFEPPSRVVRFSVKSSGPGVARTWMSAQEDGKRPEEFFPPGAGTIHAHARVVRAIPGTAALTRWIAVKVAGMEPGTRLGESACNLTQADSIVNTQMTRSGEGWSIGEYRVDFHLAGGEAPARSVSFWVNAR